MSSKRGRGKGKEKESTSSQSGRQLPPTLTSRLGSSSLHPNLQFTWEMSDKYNIWNENLKNIFKKNIIFPRQVDWEPLEEARLANSLRHHLTLTIQSKRDGLRYPMDEWIRFFSIKEPIYKELCLEFFSTVEMYNIKWVDQPFLGFRLGGLARQMTLLDMARCLPIYTDEQRKAHYFNDYLYNGAWLDETEIQMETVWQQISDVPYVPSSNYTSNIRDVNNRLLQKFLSHSIKCRGKNTEKVNVVDLWFLKHFEERRIMSIPYCVAQVLNFYGSGRRKPSKLAGGHFVTLIAKHFKINLKQRQHPYTEVPDTTVPLSYEMYNAARAVSKVNKRYVEYRPRRQPSGQTSQPSQQQSQEEQTPVMGPGYPYDDQPRWAQDLMQGISSMRVENNERWQQVEEHWQRQDDFQEEMRYENQAQRYHNAWQAHNTRRLYDLEEELEPTPYHYPPRYGHPQAVFPPPIYNESAAMAELHEERERRRDRPWLDNPEDDNTAQQPQDAPGGGSSSTMAQEGWRSWKQETAQQGNSGHWLWGDL